jgi:hypothetical protein
VSVQLSHISTWLIAALASVLAVAARWLYRHLIPLLIQALSERVRNQLRAEIESLTQVQRTEVDALILELRGTRRLLEDWIMVQDPVDWHGNLDELRKRDDQLSRMRLRDLPDGTVDEHELQRLQIEAGAAVELEERRQDATEQFAADRQSRRRLVNPPTTP